MREQQDHNAGDDVESATCVLTSIVSRQDMHISARGFHEKRAPLLS